MHDPAHQDREFSYHKTCRCHMIPKQASSLYPLTAQEQRKQEALETSAEQEPFWLGVREGPVGSLDLTWALQGVSAWRLSMFQKPRTRWQEQREKGVSGADGSG